MVWLGRNSTDSANTQDKLFQFETNPYTQTPVPGSSISVDDIVMVLPLDKERYTTYNTYLFWNLAWVEWILI